MDRRTDEICGWLNCNDTFCNKTTLQQTGCQLFTGHETFQISTTVFISFSSWSLWIFLSYRDLDYHSTSKKLSIDNICYSSTHASLFTHGEARETVRTNPENICSQLISYSCQKCHQQCQVGDIRKLTQACRKTANNGGQGLIQYNTRPVMSECPANFFSF